jgi:hypothetical protein
LMGGPSYVSSASPAQVINRGPASNKMRFSLQV